MPSVERRQRHEVDEPDEHGDESEDVEDRGPVAGRGRDADLLADADDAGGVVGPALLVVEEQTEDAADALGSEDPADLGEGLADREPDLLHAADQRGSEPDRLRDRAAPR